MNKNFYTVISDEELKDVDIPYITPTKTLAGAIDLLNISKNLDVSNYLELNKIPKTYRIYKVEEVDITTFSNEDVGFNEDM